MRVSYRVKYVRKRKLISYANTYIWNQNKLVLKPLWSGQECRDVETGLEDTGRGKGKLR